MWSLHQAIRRNLAKIRPAVCHVNAIRLDQSIVVAIKLQVYATVSSASTVTNVIIVFMKTSC